jgi:hypothetical protein
LIKEFCKKAEKKKTGDRKACKVNISSYLFAFSGYSLATFAVRKEDELNYAL